MDMSTFVLTIEFGEIHEIKKEREFKLGKILEFVLSLRSGKKVRKKERVKEEQVSQREYILNRNVD